MVMCRGHRCGSRRCGEAFGFHGRPASRHSGARRPSGAPGPERMREEQQHGDDRTHSTASTCTAGCCPPDSRKHSLLLLHDYTNIYSYSTDCNPMPTCRGERTTCWSALRRIADQMLVRRPLRDAGASRCCPLPDSEKRVFLFSSGCPSLPPLVLGELAERKRNRDINHSGKHGNAEGIRHAGPGQSIRHEEMEKLGPWRPPKIPHRWPRQTPPPRGDRQNA